VVGAEGARTELKVVDKVAEEAKIALEDVVKRKAMYLPKLEAVAKKLKAMKQMAEKFDSQLSERAKGDLKMVLDAYGKLGNAVKECDVQRDSLTKTLNAPGRQTGRIVIMEKVQGGGCMDLYGHAHELRESDAKLEWVWAPDGVASRTILPEPSAQKNPQAPKG